MEKVTLPNLGLFDIDKTAEETLGHVVDMDRNGFFYCQEGELTLSVNENSYHIRKGDIYIYPAFSKTYIRNFTPDIRGIVGMAEFNFLFNMLNPITNTTTHLYMGEHPCISLNREQCRKIERLIGIIKEKNQERESILTQHILSTLGQALCYEIMDAYYSNNHIQPIKQSRKDKVFQSFLFSLNHNLKTNREVRFYADLQNLTPRYFTTIIREQSSKTPQEWIIMYVIGEAKKLLANPLLSIKEIADEMGFANQSFFGRYFKQYAGVSPSVFRNNLYLDKQTGGR